MLVPQLPPLIMNSSQIFAAQNPHMPALAQSNIHLDILEGRDETLDVTDFFRKSSLDVNLPDRVFTGYLQTLMPTLPWTYMRIWSESFGCDVTSAHSMLPSTQLDGRLHLDPWRRSNSRTVIGYVQYTSPDFAINKPTDA